MAAHTGAAPPPPPPPPPLLEAGALLASGGRPSADRVNVERVRAAQQTGPPKRSTFAGVDSAALQHAAASLRKTEYGESLLSRDAEPILGRPNQLLGGGHWPNSAIDEELGVNQAGAAIHVPHAGADPHATFGLHDRHSNSLTPAMAHPTAINAANYSAAASSNNSNRNLFTAPSLPNDNASPLHSSSYSSYSSHTGILTPTLNHPHPQSASTIPPLAPTEHPLPVPLQLQNNGYSSAFTPISPSSSQPQPQQSAQSREVSTKPAIANMSDDRITNPQTYIHHYATQTPASIVIVDGGSSGNVAAPLGTTPTITTTRITTSSRVETESSSPASNYTGKVPVRRVNQRASDLVKDLRDSALTETQKYQNQFQKSMISQRLPPPLNTQLESIFKETRARYRDVAPIATSPPSSEEELKETEHPPHPVNQLVREMEWKLSTGINDFCSKCGAQIEGDTPGVTALGNAYHVNCFSCDECHKQLAGCSFYSVDGKNLCQVDYMASLEKCEKCATPITSKILRAMGKPYHPECFVCPACAKSLDGVPFTLDKENHAYCLDCYHERFSPRCAICLKPIAPAGNESEVARVIAMDRSYHIDCYRCEDCGLKLNSKVEGQGCYPLESHLFCRNCNLNRLKSVR